jgi:hypothetical protein
MLGQTIARSGDHLGKDSGVFIMLGIAHPGLCLSGGLRVCILQRLVFIGGVDNLIATTYLKKWYAFPEIIARKGSFE